MIIRSRIDSAHLADNLLGDPGQRDLFIYLPPGYGDSDRRYPTAYLLHAFGQNAEGLVHPPTGRQRWSPPLEDVLDPVFGRIGTAPMIVVIPDGDTRYGCGQWVDSPVTGHFERYVVDEVVDHVDSTYRTLPEPASRGVLGFSSGGFGAWNLASRNPDTFGALAMLSGDSYFDVTHKAFLYDYLTSIWPEAPNGPVEDNPSSHLVYAYSATYSPNPDNPPFFVDLPVAFRSGELITEVWERWLSFDPVVNWRGSARQSPPAAGDPVGCGRQRRLPPGVGPPAAEPLPGRGRHRPPVDRERRQPRRSVEGEDADGPAVAGRGVGHR